MVQTLSGKRGLGGACLPLMLAAALLAASASQAAVEILPRISEMGSGSRSGVVHLAEAATQVQVPLGQWVTIGGSEQSVNEVLRAILEVGSSRQESVLSIQLLVEAH